MRRITLQSKVLCDKSPYKPLHATLFHLLSRMNISVESDGAAFSGHSHTSFPYEAFVKFFWNFVNLFDISLNHKEAMRIVKMCLKHNYFTFDYI